LSSYSGPLFALQHFDLKTVCGSSFLKYGSSPGTKAAHYFREVKVSLLPTLISQDFAVSCVRQVVLEFFPLFLSCGRSVSRAFSFFFGEQAASPCAFALFPSSFFCLFFFFWDFARWRRRKPFSFFSRELCWSRLPFWVAAFLLFNSPLSSFSATIFPGCLEEPFLSGRF